MEEVQVQQLRKYDQFKETARSGLKTVFDISGRQMANGQEIINLVFITVNGIGHRKSFLSNKIVYKKGEQNGYKNNTIIRRKR